MSEKWIEIPGYETLYWINTTGDVKNAQGHIIKPFPTKDGLRVELRKFGQRETILVDELLLRAELSEIKYERETFEELHQKALSELEQKAITLPKSLEETIYENT